MGDSDLLKEALDLLESVEWKGTVSSCFCDEDVEYSDACPVCEEDAVYKRHADGCAWFSLMVRAGRREIAAVDEDEEREHDMKTVDRLEDLRAALDSTTRDGVWKVEADRKQILSFLNNDGFGVLQARDARDATLTLIAEAVNALPALLAVAKAARALIDTDMAGHIKREDELSAALTALEAVGPTEVTYG